MSGGIVKEEFMLGKILYDKIQEGDVVILAGAEGSRVQLRAHKMALTSLSTMLEAKFKSTSLMNWKVEFPTHISLEGAKAFLKALYMSKIETEAPWQILLEILELSHLFVVTSNLVEQCQDVLCSGNNINHASCHKIVGKVSSIPAANRLFQDTLEFIRKDLGRIFYNAENKGCTDLLLYWSESTWDKILSLDYLVSVKEKDLFLMLLKWRDLKPMLRNVSFSKLLPLIRFPLMDPVTLNTVVKPTNVLTNSQFNDVLLPLMVDNRKRETKWNHEERRKRTVRNSEELKISLEEAWQGDLLHLANGSLFGPCFTAAPITFEVSRSGPKTRQLLERIVLGDNSVGFGTKITLSVDWGKVTRMQVFPSPSSC